MILKIIDGKLDVYSIISIYMHMRNERPIPWEGGLDLCTITSLDVISVFNPNSSLLPKDRRKAEGKESGCGSGRW